MTNSSPAIPAVHRHVPQHLARRFAQICAAMLSEIPAPFAQPGWHFALLRQIREAPGMDRGWHASALGSDATSTGKALELFELRGYAARTIRPDDRRAKTYTLTADGEALFQDLIGPVRAVAEQILSPLSTAEADTLMVLLTRLVNAHEIHARPGAGRQKPRRNAARSTERQRP
jgi:DNA-binding MarR family transcriptional regulator